MTSKRKVKRGSLSVHERMQLFRDRVRTAARILPAGVRDELLLKARKTDAAANIDRWLSSPGLRSPK
jgi:hypothetical protein